MMSVYGNGKRTVCLPEPSINSWWIKSMVSGKVGGTCQNLVTKL